MAKKKRITKRETWESGYSAYVRGDVWDRENEFFWDLQRGSLHNLEAQGGFWDAWTDASLDRPFQDTTNWEHQEVMSKRQRRPSSYNPGNFGLAWDPHTGNVMPEGDFDALQRQRSEGLVSTKHLPAWQSILNDMYKRHRID